MEDSEKQPCVLRRSVRIALLQYNAAVLVAYSTGEAALTLNDDLEAVKEMGVTILSPNAVPHVTDL
ncbi:DUF1786 family protein [Chloroflexota bacterium]